jgi:hypothetical protein
MLSQNYCVQIFFGLVKIYSQSIQTDDTWQIPFSLNQGPLTNVSVPMPKEKKGNGIRVLLEKKEKVRIFSFNVPCLDSRYESRLLT